MITLTFDTSVRINAYKTIDNSTAPEMIKRIRAAQILLEAHLNKLIEISYNAGEMVKENPISLKPTYGPWILETDGFSILGKSTILVSEDSIVENVLKIINPKSTQSRKDFAILENHIVAKRDIFVSEDLKKHLNKAAQLSHYGIVVKSASDTVNYLRGQGVNLRAN